MAQQLRSQGAWTANKGGMEVSELPEVDVAEGQVRFVAAEGRGCM